MNDDLLFQCFNRISKYLSDFNSELQLKLINNDICFKFSDETEWSPYFNINNSTISLRDKLTYLFFEKCEADIFLYTFIPLFTWINNLCDFNFKGVVGKNDCAIKTLSLIENVNSIEELSIRLDILGI